MGKKAFRGDETNEQPTKKSSKPKRGSPSRTGGTPIYSKNLLSIARAVVRKAPGIDPLTGGPLHAEVFPKPLVKVQHVGRTVEDRDFLLTRRQLLLENLH